MKHAIPLLLGFLLGVGLFAYGLTHNPFMAERAALPLTVSENEVMSLSFDSAAASSIFLTNNGESRLALNPQDIQKLHEAPIRLSSVMLTAMNDARGRSAGFGLKFSSRSEETRLLNGEALVNSIWYVYLPGRGSLFIEQSENYWPFISEVIIPAYKNASNNWKGSWFGDLTVGPKVLGTAKVTGGTGEWQGSQMEAAESLSVTAYSADIGPVAAEGRLLIEMPVAAATAPGGTTAD